MLQTAWSWEGGGAGESLERSEMLVIRSEEKSRGRDRFGLHDNLEKTWEWELFAYCQAPGRFTGQMLLRQSLYWRKRRLPWFTSKENRKYFQVITGVNPRNNPNNVSQEAASWWLHVYFFVPTTSQILYSHNFARDSPSTQPSIDIYEQLPPFQPRTWLAWVKICCSFALISNGEWKW